jgi:thioredoxin reductase (NADPH)
LEQDRVKKDSYDVIIVGGGPAGTSAAIYTARADLRTLVVDKGLRTGAMGLATKVANYPGVPGEISGADLLQQMRDQAEGFGTELVQDKVLSAELRGKVKRIQSSQGTYKGRALIIATGSMGRAPTIPGEERLLGAGVSYCATCDGAFFRDQQVAVAGNNEEALEEALFLTRFARHVHLLVQTLELKASSDLADQVRQHPKVTLYPATRLREVIGQMRVAGVQVVERGGAEQTLPVTGVFIYVQGGKPITDFLYGQLETTGKGCLEVDDTMQTAIPGVFAVGDVLCTHLRQAVVAAAEGVRAAMSVERYLSGRSNLSPDWSRG